MPVAWLTSARDSVQLGPCGAVRVADGGVQISVEEIEHRDTGELGGGDGPRELLPCQSDGRALKRSKAPTYSPATTTGIA